MKTSFLFAVGSAITATSEAAFSLPAKLIVSASYPDGRVDNCGPAGPCRPGASSCDQGQNEYSVRSHQVGAHPVLSRTNRSFENRSNVSRCARHRYWAMAMVEDSM